MEEKKYEKGTLGWLREQQKIKARKDGFDDIEKWLDWKREKNENTSIYNPFSKKFQEDAKRLGLTGYQYTLRLIQERKLNSPTEIERKRRDHIAQERGFKDRNDLRMKMRHIWAQDLGYKDDAERQRNDLYNKGKSCPSSKNKDCSLNFGVCIGEIKIFEKVLLEIFEQVRHDKETGSLDEGIDFFCKYPKREFIDKYPQFRLEIYKEYKIQLKMRCLYISGYWIGWNFGIQYNGRVDLFILSGWNNRTDLDHVHTWLIHKDEIIRGRKLWRRDSLAILDRPVKISEFKRFELTDKIEKLQNICKELKENNA